MKHLVQLEDICWGLGDAGGQASMQRRKRGRKTDRHNQAEFLPFAKDLGARPPHAAGMNSQGSLSYEGGPENCIQAAPPHPSSYQTPACSSIRLFFKRKLSQNSQSLPHGAHWRPAPAHTYRLSAIPGQAGGPLETTRGCLYCQ